jgi:hypothetical protein
VTVAGDAARNTYGASPRSVGVMPMSRTIPTISSHASLDVWFAWFEVT